MKPQVNKLSEIRRAKYRLYYKEYKTTLKNKKLKVSDKSIAMG